MRKSARILFIMALVAVLCCVLAACSDTTGSQYTPPVNIGGNGEGVDPEVDDYENNENAVPVYLSFTYLTQSPSVFKHIYLDEFSLANIEYHVTYEVTKLDEYGDEYVEIEMGKGTPLTEDMLDSESKRLIKQAGHHMITASYTTADDYEIEGSFVVHLKERVDTELCTLTFNLGGGTALFGSDSNGVVTAKVVKGSTYSYSDFISSFRVVKFDNKNTPNDATDDVRFALSGWTGFATDSGSDYMTISSDKTFTATWTQNVTSVKFDLNLPADSADDWTTSPVAPTEQTVEKYNGLVARPSVEDFATLTGYSFAGWYTSKTGGTAWNFSSKIGGSGFTLYARWTVRTYSVTYILMGGSVDTTKSLAAGNYSVADAVASYYNGYHEGEEGYDPNYSQNFYTDLPFRVTFSGINYGAQLSGYKADLLPTAVATDKLTVGVGPAAFGAQLKKGDDYYTFGGWYTDSTYLESSKYTEGAITSNLVLFAKWDLNENLDDVKKNAYFDYLYTYTVKADGTLRVDLVKDASVSTLVIPAEISVEGVNYAVTEIGERAGLNLKSLVAIDASDATNLTTIGRQAFASDLALREIIEPTGGSGVTEVGEDAFKATQWLENYSIVGIDNPAFAVIGSVLVKYIGDPSVTSVDVSTSAHGELDGAITIASGAFKGLPYLESVTLGAQIVNVKDNAFYNCVSLENVLGGAGLKYVGYSAFLNTPYVSTAHDDNIGTAIDESTYLQLGGIYYRFISKTNTSATIPASATIIAPGAFAGANWVENIAFENASAITSIGEGAFSDTIWITKIQTYATTGTYIDSKGFVVINHILVSYTGRATTVNVPSDVKVIAPRAFTGLSNGKITNVVIPKDSQLETIENEAFYGAISLRAVSFTDTTVNALVGIDTHTFSGKTGELVNKNLKIYLYKAPLDAVNAEVVDNDPYLAWKDLKASYGSIFSELVTSSAKLNSAVLPDKYLYDGAAVNFEAVWRAAGLLSNDNVSAPNNKPMLASGAIVTRSDGITIVEDIPVADITTDGSIGLDKSFRFTVPGGEGGAAVTGTAYAYKVYAAIDNNSLSVNLPVFYSTQGVMPTDGINITYTLKDGKNTAGTMPISDPMVSVEGYKATVGTRSLNITINYYGLATYTKLSSVEYEVRKPANITIEQRTALAVPVNAEARNYFSDVQLLVTMNDGKESLVLLSDATKVTVISAADAAAQNANAEALNLDTSTLGYHTDAGIRFGTRKDGYIYCSLLYSVILSTDTSMFEYEITANVAGGATEPVREAVITGLKSGYEATIAIPSKVRLNPATATVASSNGGETFTIVGVADEAFLNKTNLEYVYIPASVKELGERAFKGCTALKQIYSFAVQDEGENPAIGMTDVTVLNEQVAAEAEITISGLGDTALAEIIVPDSYIYSIEQPGAGTNGCDRVTTYHSTVKLSGSAFSGFTGTIYLPDKQYFREYAATSLAGNDKVQFYAVGAKTPSSAKNFVIADYNAPTVNSETITGEVSINNNVNVVANAGVIVIPGSISRDTDKGRATYTVAALSEAAFSRIYANGCRDIYLPNSLRIVGGTAETRYGGHASEIDIFVYDVSEIYIYAPSTKFSAHVEYIGASCFYGCSSLLDVDFSGATALQEIGASAFYDCDNIRMLDFSNSQIEEIAASAFAECSNLVSVEFRSTLKTIGDYAFGNCVNLIYAGDGFNVTHIGAYAFHNCRSLTLVTQPATLTSDHICQSAFEGCTSLATVWLLNGDTSASVTPTNTGYVLYNANLVFVMAGKTHTDAFNAKFTRYTGNASSAVTVGGTAVKFCNAAVNWNSDGRTINVVYSGTTYTMEAYVLKA